MPWLWRIRLRVSAGYFASFGQSAPGYPLHEPKDVVWQLVALDQAEFVHLELKGCPHLRERFDEFLRITLATVLTGAQMRRKTSRESPDAVMEFEVPPIDL